MAFINTIKKVLERELIVDDYDSCNQEYLVIRIYFNLVDKKTNNNHNGYDDYTTTELLSKAVNRKHKCKQGYQWILSSAEEYSNRGYWYCTFVSKVK